MSFGDLNLNELLSLDLNWSAVMEEATSENALIAYAVACGAISAFFAYHLGANFKIALPLAAGLSIPSVIFLMRLLDGDAPEESDIWSHIFPLVVCVSAMLGCLLAAATKMKHQDRPEPIFPDRADAATNPVSEGNSILSYYRTEGSLPSSLGSISSILLRSAKRDGHNDPTEDPEVFFLLKGKGDTGSPASPVSLTLSPWITPMAAFRTQTVLSCESPDDFERESVAAAQHDEMRFADEAPCFGRSTPVPSAAH